MELCSCGEKVELAGTKCSRCAALQTLELEFEATDAEIKAAYRMLVKVWHPDRFPDDERLGEAAQEKLRAINLAYQRLCSAGSSGRRRRPPPDRGSSAPPGMPSRGMGILGKGWAIARFFIIPALLLCFLWLCGWLVLQPLDTMASSVPVAGPIYREYKVRVIGRWQAMVGDLSDFVKRPRNEPQTDAAELPAAAQSEADSQKQPARKPAGRQSASAPPAKVRVLPYVTVGLTKSEVIESMGSPSSETEDKLIYGYSELDFSNGSLVGWKIDPRSPLPAKLWPEKAVDPDLDAFWIGSSKSEVIAVQGTPTFLSENTFGYGGSEIYFQNGRVVNWKNDFKSTFLRARAR
jgi:hypothetical protein